MAHDHHHHHHDHSAGLKLDSAKLRRAFYIGITLNLAFVVGEVVYGLMYNSLALLSDAGHNFSDVISLVLALVGFRLMASKPTEKYTYGYKKAGILVSLVNAIMLILALGAIIYEAIVRLRHPQPVAGGIVAVVSFIGIFVNGATALLLMKNKEEDINIKGAYLHMLSDALVAFAVAVAGVVMLYTKWFWLDSVASIAVAILILFGTFNLFRQSLALTLDGVPEGMDFPEIKKSVLSIAGVAGFEHIHIWAISTAENALTGHLWLRDNISPNEADILKNKVRHELEHHNIKHATLEVHFGEPSGDVHFAEDCAGAM